MSILLPALASIGAAAVLGFLGLAIRYGWLRFQEHRTSTRRYLRRRAIRYGGSNE